MYTKKKPSTISTVFYCIVGIVVSFGFAISTFIESSTEIGNVETENSVLIEATVNKIQVGDYGADRIFFYYTYNGKSSSGIISQVNPMYNEGKTSVYVYVDIDTGNLIEAEYYAMSFDVFTQRVLITLFPAILISFLTVFIISKELEKRRTAKQIPIQNDCYYDQNVTHNEEKEEMYQEGKDDNDPFADFYNKK